MNWILLGLSAVACLGLSSCGGMGGESVDDPSVDKMSQLEQQWGMTPRKVHPKGYGNQQGNDYVAPAQPQPSPEPVEPAPAPAPAPSPAPAPQASASDSEPPRLDPSALQRLR